MNHTTHLSIRSDRSDLDRLDTGRSSIASVLAAAFVAIGVTACGGGGGGDSSDAFHVHATQWSVGGNTKVAISGFGIAWIADEATTGAGGTDLNGDGDKVDGVVVYVAANTKTQANTGVAATDMVWIGNELYMVVSEAADGRDWNGDTDMSDTVLVHWSQAMPTAAFVDTLATGSAPFVVAAGTRLVYASTAVAAGAMESNLRTIDAALPLTPVAVTTTDAVGALHPSILKLEEGMAFLSLNEVTEARDLNGDADATDTNVLALLDLRTASAPVRNVGLALPAAPTPLRARSVGAADWQIGFLVNEAAQGNTNLNNPALFAPSWQATQCVGAADTDTNDDVLHYVLYAAWVTDPVANPPRNTGLVGVDRIAIANGFIATITPEASTSGTLGEGTCDVNNDGDKNDRVVRWTQLVSGVAAILPPGNAANIHALDDVPGGTHGIAELQDRFVIVVDENQDNLDINGDGFKTFDLVGWLLPTATPTPWQFMHTLPPVQGVPIAQFVGASWMAETPGHGHLALAMQESVAGISLNPLTSAFPGDSDTLDSIPSFPIFNGIGGLSFPAVLIAVDPVQPGIVVAGTTGFYRVSESADNRDWSGDGQLNDRIAFRTSFTAGTTNLNGTSSAINRPVIEVDTQSGSPVCGALISDEVEQGAVGTDINGDGDRTDLVLQYFVFQ